MAFRFSLAEVLQYRRIIERQEELQLRRLQMEQARLRRSIEQLSTEVAVAQQSLHTSLQHPIPASYVQSMVLSVQASVENRRKIVVLLQNLEQQYAEQLHAYQEASRARQMLSEMEEQQRDAWEQEQVRTEQKALDDLFSARRRRDKRNPRTSSIHTD